MEAKLDHGANFIYSIIDRIKEGIVNNLDEKEVKEDLLEFYKTIDSVFNLNTIIDISFERILIPTFVALFFKFAES